MSITAGALRELHRLHRQATDLREQIQRGPKQVHASQKAIERCEATAAEEKESYMKARVSSDDKQLQLVQREDRIKELREKLNGCSSNREYQALVEQIAADEQANNVLSDEILEMLEKLDEHQERATVSADNVGKVKQELVNSTRRVEETQKGLQDELERVTQELQQAEAALPADFKSDYERVSRVRGEDALAQVESECCGGCYQILTPQTMNLLHMARPVFCKNCGCLLYLPEDRSVGGE